MIIIHLTVMNIEGFNVYFFFNFSQ